VGFKPPAKKPDLRVVKGPQEELPLSPAAALAEELKPEKQLPDLYAKLDAAIADEIKFKRKHAEILETLDEKTSKVKTLQEQIKALCHQAFAAREGQFTAFAGSNIEVVVKPAHNQEIDEARLIKEQAERLKEIGALVDVPTVKAHKTIDKKAINSAIHRKVLPADFLKPYTTTGEARTPSVSFTPPAPKETK
jgi:hypothetical protein